MKWQNLIKDFPQISSNFKEEDFFFNVSANQKQESSMAAMFFVWSKKKNEQIIL